MPRLKKKSQQMIKNEDKQRKKAERKVTAQREKKRVRNKTQYEQNRDRVISASKASQERKLSDPALRLSHQVRNREAQERRLSDPVLRQSHQVRNRVAQERRLSDPALRQSHQVRNREAQERRLSDPALRQSHQVRNREAQERRLSDPALRQSHQVRNREAQERRLSDPALRQSHQVRNREAQERRLSDPALRQSHQVRNREAQERRLSDPALKQSHQVRNREAQERRLSDPALRQSHQVRNKVAQERRLSNPASRQVHRTRLREAQERRLSNPASRQVHLARAKQSQKRRLSDPTLRQLHLALLSRAQRRRLSDPTLRQIHLARLSQSQRCRLSIQAKRLEHQARNFAAKTRRLSDLQKRIEYLAQLRICQRRRLSRPEAREMHHQRLKISQQQRVAVSRKQVLKKNRKSYRSTMRNPLKRADKRQKLRIHYQKKKDAVLSKKREKLFDSYKRDIKHGPCFKCDCCLRLWFPSSVKPVRVTDKNRDLLQKVCIYFDLSFESIVVCCSCYNSIVKNKVPSLSVGYYSDLQFPEVPEVIKKLSSCEERFLCPRLLFMQIREVVGYKQYHVKGRAVNVPTTVDNSVHILPRVASETDTIPIALKRKREFKQNYMFESVRPKVIVEAAKALQDSELFREEGITIDLSRFQSQSLEAENSTQQTMDGENQLNEEEQEEESDDELVNVPDLETLLQSEAIIFAPGEGRTPLSLFADTFVEAKSFIKIYGGHLKSKPAHLSYQDWVKSEIMREDRRCATCIPKLFFSALKLRMHKVAQSIGFCLRKSKCKSSTITAGDILNDSRVNDLILHDSGYKIFAPDRGSPAFFEEKKKEVFAMLRQLGPPTFFLTYSPAETKWPELLVILNTVVNKTILTEEEVLKLSYEEKVHLIREDPVTCARYVDYRMRRLLKLVRENDSFFREHTVLDSYFRVEFQQRGSPHLHGFVWLKNAPVYKAGENNEEVIKFIERFVTVSNDIEEELLHLQTHHHTFTCYKQKSGQKKCRFDIPFFPMKSSIILEPFNDDDISKDELKSLRKKRDELQAYLVKVNKERKKISYDDFLTEVHLSEDKYLKTIRSRLKRPIIFLKRGVDECMINPYNIEMLRLHRANMDIQFILDSYSCANYVLNYVNKSRKGLSRLLHDAVEEVKKGNFSLKEKFKSIASHFLNASEFSAQESVYYVLGMPLSIASRVCDFINTSHPDKRVVIAKSKPQLRDLPIDSTDVFTKTKLDRYIQRPDELEDLCLAYFEAFYNYRKSRPTTTSKDHSDEDYDDVYGDSDSDSDGESESHQNSERSRWLALKNNAGFISKRRKAKVIRYVRFNRESHEEDYLREHLMLFVPWRNEEEELLNVDYEEEFKRRFEMIKQNKKLFVYSEELEDTLLQAFVETNNENYSEDESDTTSQNEYQVFDAEHEEGDLLEDLGIQERQPRRRRNYVDKEDVHFPVPFLISDSEYDNLLASLNTKQRMYLLHILHSFKTDSLPFYECILGGAGVGKSRLITAIQQCLLRHFNKKLGASLDATRVLICAFTGKAAYNVRGITLHTASVLPHNQYSGELPPLSSNVLNTLYSKLHDLRLLIIDEISQVGSRLFGQLDSRFKQIFKNSKPFGGVPVILLGDFWQLGPVASAYIFQADESNPYGHLIGNPLWEMFRLFQLTEIMRQKDDATFAAALNSLAEGCLTQEQIALFQSRETDAKDVPNDAIRLFRTNADVHAFNDLMISSSKNEVIVVNAIDIVHGQGTKKLASKALQSVQNAPLKDTSGLPTILKLCEDIKYMLTVNVQIQDGLVNGAVGILKSMGLDIDHHPIRLWVSFSDPNIGKNTRREYQSWPDHVDQSWTPVCKEVRIIRPLRNASVSVTRRQFPIIAAEAMTYYKSQGGTYPLVAVYLKTGIRRNELYVAMSRCISLSGLYLIGKFKPPPPPGPYDDVAAEIRRLKKRPLLPSCLFTLSYQSKKTVVYHNVQSLKAHLKQVQNDSNYICANILILAETWLKCSDGVSLPNFDVIARQDVQRCVTHAHGIVLFAKATEELKIIHQSSSEEKGNAHNLLLFLYEGYAICCGYVPPSTPFHVIKDQFSEMLAMGLKMSSKLILLGDFNQNIQNLNGVSSEFKQALETYQLSTKIDTNQPSTDEGTHIDICFSTTPANILAGFSESYFSYHKPIVTVLNPDENETAIICHPVIPSEVFARSNYSIPQSSRLQNVCLDGAYLFQQLRDCLSIENNLEIITDLTEFLRETALFNGQFKKTSPCISGFLKIQTTGDGSCFYNSISLLYCGSEALTFGLRALVSAHLISNKQHCDEINSAFHDDTVTEKSVLDISNYAEILEVYVMANITGRHIDIYEADIGKWHRMLTSTSNGRKQPLRVLLDGQHYSALKKTNTRYYEKEIFVLPRSQSPFRVFQKKRTH